METTERRNIDGETFEFITQSHGTDGFERAEVARYVEDDNIG